MFGMTVNFSESRRVIIVIPNIDVIEMKE